MELFSDLFDLKSLAFSSFELKSDLGKSGHLVSSYLKSVPVKFQPKRFSNFSEQRKIEFVMGRICAKEALDKMSGSEDGLPIFKETGIGMNDDRSPSWPKGAVGSITHSPIGVMACTGKVEDFLGLGLDLECLNRSNSLNKIKNKVFTGADNLLYKELPKGFEETDLIGLVFSAKESLFKCLYPLAKTFFYFYDAEVVKLNIDTRSYTLRLKKGLGGVFKEGDLFEGYFCTSIEDHILTLVPLRSCTS
ncbi:MAG: 4'-phosphopantetheinyl transferase superfamily protein [Bdellovibrionota bacterium]|nr:4'-phosphopantetheinyl transferase superfamily protein [Bdellovibrionota bacterium]